MVLVVTSIDKSDVDGTQRMIHDLCELYEKKTGIVVNKVPQTVLSGKTPIKLDTRQLPILDLVPCSCDVLQSGENICSLLIMQSIPSLRNCGI
jgi:hypothetical protein